MKRTPVEEALTRINRGNWGKDEDENGQHCIKECFINIKGRVTVAQLLDFIAADYPHIRNEDIGVSGYIDFDDIATEEEKRRSRGNGRC